MVASNQGSQTCFTPIDNPDMSLCSAEMGRGGLACLPGLPSDEDLAGVHDPAAQTSSVDGAQGRAQLHDVGPDERLGEEAGVLPRRGGLVLACWRHGDNHTKSVGTTALP